MWSEGQHQGGAEARAGVKGIICLSTAAVRDSSARCHTHSCQIGSVCCESSADKLSLTFSFFFNGVWHVTYLHSWSLKWVRVVMEMRIDSDIETKSGTELNLKSKGNKVLHLSTTFTVSFMHAQAVWNEHVMYTSGCMWGG